MLVISCNYARTNEYSASNRADSKQPLRRLVSCRLSQHRLLALGYMRIRALLAVESWVKVAWLFRRGQVVRFEQHNRPGGIRVSP